MIKNIREAENGYIFILKHFCDCSRTSSSNHRHVYASNYVHSTGLQISLTSKEKNKWVSREDVKVFRVTTDLTVPRSGVQSPGAANQQHIGMPVY